MIRLPTKRHEVLSLLLILSLLGAEFLSLAHQVVAHHALCLVHGHVIDAKDAKSAHAQAFAFTDAMLALSAMDVSGMDQALHASVAKEEVDALSQNMDEEATGHTHCDKTVFLKVGHLRFHHPILRTDLWEREFRPFFTSLHLIPVIGPLELAPKHSPPWVS